MKPISTWAAAAPPEISEGKTVAQKAVGAFEAAFISAPTSVWMNVKFSERTRIAFRLVFNFGAVFKDVSVSGAEGDEIFIVASSDLGKFETTVRFYSSESAVFRYTTVFTPAQDMFVPFSPRDVLPLTASGEIATKGSVHFAQQGTRSGHLFFETQYASVFYFQNLTALSEYCDVTKTSVGDSVGGNWPEVGFKLPEAHESPIQKNTAVTVSDAFVLLTDATYGSAAQISTAYLDSLAQIYLLLPKPETTYNDWIGLASDGLGSLKENKGCWTQADGKSYLNAYVCDYDTPPEIMVQLAVLVPLTEYFKWLGQKDEVLLDLRDGLNAFYDEKLKTISRWLPSLRHRLDQAEPQKKEDVMDAWYLHHPLMNLSRMAIWKDKVAEELLLKSIDYAINVARHFDYDWPVFYETDTLDVVKRDKGEKDVPGAYANLMLQMRDLTGEKKYFNEAVKAAQKLEESGLEIFYQANNTAFSAATMLRLYKETNEQKYLDLTYVCLGALFRNVQIWDGKYGYGKHYSRFFAIYPLSDAPYIAPYEELEVFAAFHYFLIQAQDVELRPSVKLLIAEFMRYFVFRMPFYYPQYLPKEAISDEVKTGEIDRGLLIPLEDLCDGWEQSGKVGQEVYGAAGAGFGIVPRQYFKLSEQLMLFVDYPLINFRNAGKNAVTFQMNGDARLECRLRLIGDKKDVAKAAVVDRDAKQHLEPMGEDNSSVEFALKGDAKIRIEWK